MQLQFRDSAINIRSDADGDLDINADDEIELNSTLIDINGNVEISGTLAQADAITMATDKKIIFRDTAIHISSTADGDLSIAADDEIDITLAKVKVKIGGSHAGHNGLKSIDQHIGLGYTRVRIGIDRPKERNSVANYVLNNFSKSDNEIIERLIDRIADATTYLIREQNSEFIKALSDSFKNSTEEDIKQKKSTEEESTAKIIRSDSNFLQNLFKRFKNGSKNG